MGSGKVKLSIIIPVWNQEKLVIRALDSIPRREDIEVLVWDDGSKDETLTNLLQYKAEHPELRLSVYGDKVNRGTSYAKNQLLDKIQGEYFTLLDSDDYLLPAYEKAMAEMDGTDVICFDCEINDGTVWALTEEDRESYCATWSRFLKRETLGHIRFREDRKADQDWFYNQECLKATHKYTRIVAYHYNFPRAGSLINILTKRNAEGERMYKNVFYFSNLNDIGGVETMLWNTAQKYGKDYDITMLYRTGSKAQAERLSSLVRVKQIKNEKISCEKLFIAYSTDILKQCEADEVYFIVHGDYKALHATPPVDPKIDHYIGVSEHVCKTFTEITGIPCEVAYNPFVVKKPKKVLKLITASRLTKEKGKDRMKLLAKALDRAGIPWLWTVFTNDKEAIDHPRIIYRKPELDILGYVQDADYLVQLSDTEGYAYSIIEALSVGTPVIVTDLPVCAEMGVEDGVTGFILPLDMSDIPLEGIYKGVKKFKYTPRKDKYAALLAEGESTYSLDDKSMVELTIRQVFFDVQRNREMQPGERVWEARERAERIVNMGFARYVE